MLAIPLEEVRRHFEINERQSLKVVAPARLSATLFAELRAQGVSAKPEVALEGERWRHAAPEVANPICESREFGPAPARNDGAFTISFGNERGAQEAHLHREHAEVYFSEHPLEAEYRLEGETATRTVKLAQGGALVFAPGVIHRVKLGGLTIVIETPAVEGDKFRG